MAARSTPPLARIAAAIHQARGHRVMLDADLAALYGVTTKRLNGQVTRNRSRFPEDFMFVLTAEEAASLRSQFATTNRGRGGRRTRLRAFTEPSAVMIANVLKSRVAVDASIQVVRAFVQLRELALTHAELGRRLDNLERKYDSQFKVVFQAIRELMTPSPAKPRAKIGFRRSGEHE